MVGKASIPLAVVFSAILVAAATIDKRIIGGEDAKDGEFPSTVAIDGSNGWCGGILVDSITVVTAGHCLYGASTVRAGSVNRREGGKEAKIKSQMAHPDYLKSEKPGPYFNNDIGVIKLSTPIEESDKIRYAKLPASGSDPVANSTAIAAGWGMGWTPRYNLVGNGGVDQLSKVVIPIQTREDCAMFDSGAADRDNIVCAGGDDKNVCHGDSGSPLYDQETGQWIGIASWVIEDAEHWFCKKAPSVFIRVGSYISFINQWLGDVDLPAADTRTIPGELEKHCGRFGNDKEKEACRLATAYCTTRQSTWAEIDDILICVDQAQACADFESGKQQDHCFNKAKACKEEKKLPIGELTELAKCAKDGMNS